MQVRHVTPADAPSRRLAPPGRQNLHDRLPRRRRPQLPADVPCRPSRLDCRCHRAFDRIRGLAEARRADPLAVPFQQQRHREDQRERIADVAAGDLTPSRAPRRTLPTLSQPPRSRLPAESIAGQIDKQRRADRRFRRMARSRKWMGSRRDSRAKQQASQTRLFH